MSKGSTSALTTNVAQQVFLFADAYKHYSGKRDLMKESLGGKGAGLAEMIATGINVPPGLTITTQSCRDYYTCGKKVPDELYELVFDKLKLVEQSIGRQFGSTTNPLLVSVRSGAKFSMPGMMDTILNLGLNDETVKALTKITNNERFALDSYRRLIQMYGNVVLDISKDDFEHSLTTVKQKAKIKEDSELNIEHFQSIIANYKSLITTHTSKPFEQDVKEQLKAAIQAVFKSWNNDRAIYYRNLNKIDHNLGTAVNIQAMVFGNLNNESATGVCFTRNPSTGQKELYGEYLTNAQGEDVVAGIRTPKKIAELANEMPKTRKQLVETAAKLEAHYADMQDIEFTVENNQLYILQTRTGKRTAAAALKVAVDLVSEKVIDQDQALLRVEPLQLNQLLLPSFPAESKEKAKKAGKILATGLNASPGAAVGKIIFDPDRAQAAAAQGEKVILVRIETCPDDIHGIVSAQGVVTSRGGMTSHAAVVARGMGKPCVAGCDALNIDLNARQLRVDSKVLKEGETISIDGATGEIFQGIIESTLPTMSQDFKTFLGWADNRRRMSVRANADTPLDAKTAREFGAQGIGLCRTEHMFMSQDRLPVMQAMIMAENKEERQKELTKLLPMQKNDFTEIFKVMEGLPVTIRLLDPPLHEFLPKYEELIAHAADKKSEKLLQKVRQLKEANPMMGLRGCRLGLLFPEINEMQVRAIFEAALAVKKQGIKVLPEIMIPLISDAQELIITRKHLESVAIKVMEEQKEKVEYRFGTMIELPRACLIADQIAAHADFFSFGTNDLTQMTFGFSRDDAEGKFLQRYLEGIDIENEKIKILTNNPFETLDRQGVGKLMKLAIEYGLQTNPKLKIGICGEHGGDPNSIEFAEEIGLSYVSCSPYRIPLARLAAAQGLLKNEAKTIK